jgi:hypothetical protein
MIAQLSIPPIPWSTTGQFTLGLLGLLAVVGTLLFIWNQGKRAFGRTPPMNEELDKRDRALRKMIFASEANIKERMTRLENLYVEMQADRLRKWDELQREFGQLKSDLSFIRGRFEKDQS